MNIFTVISYINKLLTMRLPFIIAFCIYSVLITAANQPNPQKLLKQLETAKSDSLQVELYRDLGNYYKKTQYDSAFYYFNKGLKIARNNNFTLKEAHLLLSKSITISYSGNYYASIDSMRSALFLYKSINNTLGISSAYNSIGVNYYNLSIYDSCRAYWRKTSELNKKIDNQSGLATNYANLGVANYVQNRYEEALDNFIKSLEIRKTLDDNNKLASIYMKIALIYQNHIPQPEKHYRYTKEALKLYKKEGNKLGQAKALTNIHSAYEILDSTELAKKSLKKALEIAEEIGNKRLLGNIYNSISSNLLNENKKKEALDYLYKAKDIFDQLEQKRELGRTYNIMGNIFYDLADYHTAIAYYTSGLEVAKETKIFSQQVVALNMLAKIFAEKNNYKKAYIYHKKYSIAQDSLAQKERMERLEELEAKFTTKEQKQKIALLEKQQQLKDIQIERSKNFRNSLIIISLLILGLGLLAFQKYRQKVSLNNKLRERNKEVRQKNKEIRYQSANLKEFNKLLMEKNRLIEQQKDEMEESNTMKDRVFSIIGHDLRSPMASMKSSIYLLENDDINEEKRKRLIQLMKSDVDSTIDLLENLLMWAKKQDKQLVINPKKHDLNEIVEDAIYGVQGMAANKDISINLQAEKTFEDMLLDENMISSVMRNLLTNAIKFSPKSGTINVQIRQQASMVRVSVKDEGVGMNSETIQKIMQTNNYYTQPGTHKEKGSGLGLNLCIDFIKRHKGNLVIESEPGKGSDISFTIPM